MTISRNEHQVFSTGETKKEALEELSKQILDEVCNRSDFYIVEVIDLISIEAKQVIETTITNSNGREMKLDSRDRLVPTERARASSLPEVITKKEELEVEEILDKVGLGD